VSEFAKSVLKLPRAPEREFDERDRKRLFRKQKAELKDAIIFDKRLTPQARIIGYKIADLLNFTPGCSWPSQEYLAEQTGFSERTIRTSTKRLADSDFGLWFSRSLDGKNYCYFPRFDRLSQTLTPVENTGKSRPRTSANDGVLICRLSSIQNPLKEIPEGAGERQTAQPIILRKAVGSADDRSRKIVALGDLDETLTAAARSEGKRQFVFCDSTPWQLWNEYLSSQGLPLLRPRQHMVSGALRTGSDVPTLYPPGYGRYRTPRNDRP